MTVSPEIGSEDATAALLGYSVAAVSLSAAVAFCLGALFVYGEFSGAGEQAAMHYLTFSDLVNSAATWAIPSFLGIAVGQLAGVAFRKPVEKIRASQKNVTSPSNRITYFFLCLLVALAVLLGALVYFGRLPIIAMQVVLLLYCAVPATLGSWIKYVAPALSARATLVGFLIIANAWIALLTGLGSGFGAVRSAAIITVQTSSGTLHAPLVVSADRGAILISKDGSILVPWEKILAIKTDNLEPK
jgi:hypothetical protein